MGKQGFSLVELMVALSIVGILVLLAMPRFKIFQVKARQAEAKVNIKHIHSLLVSYQAEYGTYPDMPQVGVQFGGTIGSVKISIDGGPNQCPPNEIGFALGNCSAARYGYHVDGTGTCDDFIHGDFVIRAISGRGNRNRVYDGCDNDFWRMTDLNPMIHSPMDVTKYCTGYIPGPDDYF